MSKKIIVLHAAVLFAVSGFVKISPAQEQPNKALVRSQAVVYVHSDEKLSDVITVRDLLGPHVDSLVLATNEEEGIRVKIFSDIEQSKANEISDLLKKDVTNVEFAPFELEWTAFSIEKFEELRGKQNVAVLFQAKWCFQRIEEDADILLKIRTLDIQLLRVDKTKQFLEAKRFRDEHGVNSGPTMLCFPKQQPDQKVVIDNIDLLTSRGWRKTIQSTFRNDENENALIQEAIVSDQ